MILTGYNSINEKVTGELADALKSMSASKKSNFIKSIGDVDFNRSIDKATIIKSARDSRLKDSGNIIIGVYTNADDNKKYMVAYRPGVGTLSEDKNVNVFDKNGNKLRINNFGDLSWTKWLSLMSSVYVIDKDSIKLKSNLDRNNTKTSKDENTIKFSPSKGIFVKQDSSGNETSLNKGDIIEINGQKLRILGIDGKGFTIITCESTSSYLPQSQLNKLTSLIINCNQYKKTKEEYPWYNDQKLIDSRLMYYVRLGDGKPDSISYHRYLLLYYNPDNNGLMSRTDYYSAQFLLRRSPRSEIAKVIANFLGTKAKQLESEPSGLNAFYISIPNDGLVK